GPVSCRDRAGCLEVLLEQALRLGEGADLEELLAQRAPVRQAARVSAEVLAELDHRALLVALERDRVARVLEHDAEAFDDVRILGDRTAVRGGAGLREDPRRAVRAARDHDARAARVLAHAPRVVAGPDVAVADHGDVQRVHDRGDLVPVRGAGVHLRAAARVQGQGPGAGVLAAQRDLDGVARLLAPATADLHRGGQRRGAIHRTDDRLHEVQVLEAPGAAVAGDHLLDRTAEIDVDEIGPVDIGDQRRGVRHRHRVRPEDLHADRTLHFVEAQVLVRARAAPPDALRAHELADHDVRAEAAAQAPERRFAHPRLGREVERYRAAAEQ